MPNASPPPPAQDPERARAATAREGEVARESGCPACDSAAEPAGDLFLDQSDINPRRRIVRARRPPPPNVPSASITATSGGDNVADAAALGADPTANADGGGDDAPDLSGAIGFLQQLNGARTSVSGATTAGNSGESASNTMRSGNFSWNTESNDDDQMRRRQVQDDDDEEEAEDSDDDDSFGHPSRFFEGFLSHMSELARRNASRTPHQILNTKIRPDDDDEESDDEHEDSTDVRCAACYRIDNQNHKWRRLVTLPCCGTNGREANSSTRFCAACILKLAVTRPSSSNNSEYHLYDDEPDEYPARKFYEKNVQRENRRFCECPRCRDILLVKIKGVKPAGEDSDDDSSEIECDCSDCAAERRDRPSRKDLTAKSISINVPSFKAKCWYIGRKRGVAKLLWKVALLHHNFIPFEALGGEEEKGVILRLTGWGIIEKIPGKRNTSLYQIDKEDQTKLIKFFRLKNPSEKDQKSECLLMSDMGPCLLYAAWRHLWDECRIDRSLRLLNRFFFLGLHFFGYLPPLPLSWRQELVVTALILFSVTLAAQFLCVLVVYAAAFLGVGLSVCYVLKRSNSIKSCWWQAILLSYFVYKLNKWFYESPYLSWGNLVAPKAMILVKKMMLG